MTITPPVGCISKAEERLRNMVASCQAFQAWTGCTTAADARERIYLVDEPEPERDDEEPDGVFSLAERQSRRPFALIWTGDAGSFNIAFDSSEGGISPSGTLGLMFEDNIPQELESNYQEAYRRFVNTVGQVLHSEELHNPGIVELMRQQFSDRLAISHITLVRLMRTGRHVKATMGDAQMCELEIAWGANA
jgi:hypothetical protein